MLFEYDFEIVHRKGHSHANADTLSRRPCELSCKQCQKADANSDKTEKVNVIEISSDDEE